MTVTDTPGTPGNPDDAPESDAPRSERETPDGHGANGRGSTGNAGTGSVAEEAALLVELLGSFGAWGGTGTRPADDEHQAGEPSPDESPPEGAGSSTRKPGHDCTCGGRTPQACRLCPVCQLVSFVQNVSPETIERVADFATFAASALHEVATAARERTTGTTTGTTTGAGPGDPRP